MQIRNGLTKVDYDGHQSIMPLEPMPGVRFPFWIPVPDDYPYQIDHTIGEPPGGTCKFEISGITPGEGDINVLPSPHIPINDPREIPNAIRRHRCCNLLFSGHQGGDGNPGGVITGGGTVILPSTIPGGTPADIRQALLDVGCKKCEIFLYACGALHNRNIPDYEDRRDRARRKIGTLTGCDVWGTKHYLQMVPTGIPPCNFDPETWWVYDPRRSCTWEPTPMYPYPSDLPIGRPVAIPQIPVIPEL
jgi:hypothetical protein